jgi:hypothetical protein
MSGYFVDTFSKEIQHISVSTLYKNKVTTLSFSLYLPCLAVQDNQTLNCRTSLAIRDLRSANQMPPFQEISSSQASIIFSKTRISTAEENVIPCTGLYSLHSLKLFTTICTPWKSSYKDWTAGMLHTSGLSYSFFHLWRPTSLLCSSQGGHSLWRVGQPACCSQLVQASGWHLLSSASAKGEQFSAQCSVNFHSLCVWANPPAVVTWYKHQADISFPALQQKVRHFCSMQRKFSFWT